MVAFENTINSASTVNKATISCLLHSQEIGSPAIIKILSLVDYLVFLHLA